MVRLAGRQHGNVTRRQLLDAGFSPTVIARLTSSGVLHHVHRNVYAVGRPPHSALERAAAAVLACGPTAALSHFPALALWGLTAWPASVRHVTVTQDRRPRGIRVHVCRTLLPRDLRTREGIRVTSLGRTVLDCAPGLSDRRLTRLVNEALRARRLNQTQLADLARRCPTHPGAPKLRRFIGPELVLTRSVFEEQFLAFCARHGLPRPLVNHSINGYEVDIYFEAEQVIVELDGWEFHKTRDAFERDRLRDADAYEAGAIPTIRITYERLRAEPAREARRLHTILERRRS